MGRIYVLDDHIANQIAAGEVVERPASVVKELVENAIDAEATKIEVALEEGGLASIRVADNGSGMSEDDVRTAFLRHATSKIRTGRDLFQIRTLGFRGEALPSIAAVAKVECVTSPGKDGAGRRVAIEGGVWKEDADAAAPQGTVFHVKELFFNTPARLKYMKTVQTELGHVSDYLYRMALAYPRIAFTFTHNGSRLLQTSGQGDLLQAIAAIYGTASAKAMVSVVAEHPDFRLFGYSSKPDITRANRSGISLIVNGRYIRHYGLTQAILQSYHTLLPIGRYPLAVLHLDMDPSLVDVNVHPSKLEVRFSKEAELAAFVQETLRTALLAKPLIPNAAVPRETKEAAVVQEKLELYRSSLPPQAPAVPREWPGRVNEERIRDWIAPPSKQADAAAQQPRTLPAFEPVAAKETPPIGRKDVECASPSSPGFPMLTPVGHLHGTYIVAQSESGMYLIDQHAAHERIHYEYYAEKFAKPEAASQELLLPITLELTPSEAAVLKERLSLLEQAGLYLEPFGGSAFLVRAYPEWLPKGEEKQLVDEMVEWTLQGRSTPDIGKLREKAAILCACKASIKANQRQSLLEAETLLNRLALCKQPYTCPHGRPIMVHFSKYDLEKMFKRVM